MSEQNHNRIKRKLNENCKHPKAVCKTDELITAYNELEDEQKQIDFLISLQPDDFYILALNKKLKSKQLKAVYCNKAHVYYKMAKRNFSKYYCYCNIFQNQINDSEKQLLIKKLNNPKHYHLLNVACDQLKFLKPNYDQLQAIYTAYKLSL